MDFVCPAGRIGRVEMCNDRAGARVLSEALLQRRNGCRMAGIKIGINTTCAVAGGAVTHLRNLLPPMLDQAGEDRIVVIGEASTREELSPPSGVEWVEIPPSNGGLAKRILRENFEIPNQLKLLGVDVLFHPGNFAIFRSPVPQVILIHNLAPFLEEVIRGESWRQRVRLGLLKLLTRRSLSMVSGAIFISTWGRNLVLGSASFDETKIPVIPFGAEHGSSKRDSSVLKRWELESNRFVLSVSHIYRYKRIEKLLEAWAQLGERVAQWPLLIVGEPFDVGHTRALRAIAAESKAPVIFTGSLDAPALASLMAAARLFVFTSEAENLPITLLEAMAAGCPILTNRHCSMPETCGDAARYADPATPESYRENLEALLWDDELLADLRARSFERARSFRWDEAAGATLKILRAAARVQRVAQSERN